MHLSRRDLYKLTALGATPLALAACGSTEAPTTASSTTPAPTSAEAAGCAVLVVQNHVPVPDGPRRVFRDTLAGLGPADLGAVLADVRRSVSAP